MEISRMSTSELEEALSTGQHPNYLERAILMELRRRTENLSTMQVHGTRLEDREDSRNDFFWQMQVDILEDLLDSYLDGVPITGSQKRAVKDRAVRYMLQNAIIVYQGGESVLEESGILEIAESFVQDYQWIEPEQETQQEEQEPERAPLGTQEQAISRAAQRRLERGVRRRR